MTPRHSAVPIEEDDPYWKGRISSRDSLDSVTSQRGINLLRNVLIAFAAIGICLGCGLLGFMAAKGEASGGSKSTFGPRGSTLSKSGPRILARSNLAAPDTSNWLSSAWNWVQNVVYTDAQEETDTRPIWARRSTPTSAGSKLPGSMPRTSSSPSRLGSHRSTLPGSKGPTMPRTTMSSLSGSTMSGVRTPGAEIPGSGPTLPGSRSPTMPGAKTPGSGPTLPGSRSPTMPGAKVPGSGPTLPGSIGPRSSYDKGPTMPRTTMSSVSGSTMSGVRTPGARIPGSGPTLPSSGSPRASYGGKSGSTSPGATMSNIRGGTTTPGSNSYRTNGAWPTTRQPSAPNTKVPPIASPSRPSSPTPSRPSSGVPNHPTSSVKPKEPENKERLSKAGIPESIRKELQGEKLEDKDPEKVPEKVEPVEEKKMTKEVPKKVEPVEKVAQKREEVTKKVPEKVERVAQKQEETTKKVPKKEAEAEKAARKKRDKKKRSKEKEPEIVLQEPTRGFFSLLSLSSLSGQGQEPGPQESTGTQNLGSGNLIAYLKSLLETLFNQKSEEFQQFLDKFAKTGFIALAGIIFGVILGYGCRRGESQASRRGGGVPLGTLRANSHHVDQHHGHRRDQGRNKSVNNGSFRDMLTDERVLFTIATQPDNSSAAVPDPVFEHRRKEEKSWGSTWANMKAELELLSKGRPPAAPSSQERSEYGSTDEPNNWLAANQPTTMTRKVAVRRQPICNVEPNRPTREDEPYEIEVLEELCGALENAFPPTAKHAFCLRGAPFPKLLEGIKYFTNQVVVECKSIAEVHVSLASGTEPEDIIYDVPVATPTELQFALEQGLLFKVDNFQEVASLDLFLSEKPALRTTSSKIGLRVDPQLKEPQGQSHSHPDMNGLKTNRAGLLALYDGYPWLTGLHIDVGAGGGLDALVEGAKVAAEFAKEVQDMRDGQGRPMGMMYIQIGGGLSLDDAQLYGTAELFEHVGKLLQNQVPELFEFPKVITEMGRYLTMDLH